MSKLEELMEDYCPDGVEYKPLKEIATIVRGSGLQKKDFTDEGIGCIHYGQIYTRFGAFTDQVISHVSPEYAKKLKKVEPGDLVVAVTSENVEDVCKCVAWLGKDSIVTGGHAVVVKHKQNPKFLSYYFQSEDFFKQKAKAAQGTKVIDVSPQKLGEIVFPVPPLPVQQEIARILDEYTLAKDNIICKLKDEIKIREKQYAYVEGKILSNYEKSFPTKPIGNLADTFIGLATTTTKWKTDSGVLLLHNSDIQPGKIVLKQREYLNPEFVKRFPKKIHKSGDIITVHTGAVGTSAIITPEYEGTIGFTTIVTRLKENSDVTAEYLCQFLNSEVCKEQINGKTISERNNLNLKKFNEINVPIPPKDKQLEKSNLLMQTRETFSLIKANLENEIEARQKQYEYYRDKLLTFKRKV